MNTPKESPTCPVQHPTPITGRQHLIDQLAFLVVRQHRRHTAEAHAQSRVSADFLPASVGDIHEVA